MADIVENDRSRNLKGGLHYLDMRTKIVRFLTNVGKFAVDSAVFNSLKIATGRNQAQKFLRDGLKVMPHPSSLNDKKPEELKLVMDKMQAKIEEAEEYKTKIQLHHNTTAQTVDGSEPLKKLPGEDVKGSNVMQNDKGKIFIRSRL